MQNLYEFPDHLSNLYRMLELNRARLERDMASGLAASEGAGFNEKHAKWTQDLADASKKLGQEIRAWLENLAGTVGNLSQARKIQLLLDFVQSLPAATRYDVYDRCMAAELSRGNDGVKLHVPARHIRKQKARTKNGSTTAARLGRPARSGDVDQGVPQEPLVGDDPE